VKHTFNKIKRVDGELFFKGDKSISHRVIFFSAMAEGISEIENISDCEDVKSTISAFEMLGAKFIKDKDKLIIQGIGRDNFKKPEREIFCGNSGTTARLLSGLLATQKFSSTITGDDSLSTRPMKRIIEPLELMGAKIEHKNFKLPITFYPTLNLHPIDYVLKIPSAQVKSAILIAGLFLSDKTKVKEKIFSRDHTERILNLNYEFLNTEKIIYSSSEFYPKNQNYFVPGDISSAAFFIVLTLLTENSELLIKNISLNPTRTGFLKILKQMNANITIEEIGVANGEPYGNILTKSSKLQNIEISPDLIPNIIDEIPILSLAGVFADNDFTIKNCKELRFKETDRISALCKNYEKIGLDVYEFYDGFSISGKIKNHYCNFETFDDHRIAMTFAILSMLLNDGGEIDNQQCIKISNPDFFNQLSLVTVAE